MAMVAWGILEPQGKISFIKKTDRDQLENAAADISN